MTDRPTDDLRGPALVAVTTDHDCWGLPAPEDGTAVQWVIYDPEEDDPPIGTFTWREDAERAAEGWNNAARIRELTDERTRLFAVIAGQDAELAECRAEIQRLSHWPSQLDGQVIRLTALGNALADASRKVGTGDGIREQRLAAIDAWANR